MGTFSGFVGKALTQAIPGQDAPDGKITLKTTHCRFCGAYNVHTSANGKITWETPPDDCCVQRAEQLIEQFARHARQIQAKEVENEAAFDRKKADQIEELERFKRQKKIDELLEKHYKSNQANLDYYEELMNFVDSLRAQITLGEIQDARDIRPVA